MSEVKPQFIQDIEESFGLNNGGEQRGPYNSAQCGIIAEALKTIYIDTLRQTVLNNNHDGIAFAGLDDQEQDELDMYIQTRFLMRPDLMRLAIQALRDNQGSEEALENVPALLGELFAHLTYKGQIFSQSPVAAEAAMIAHEKMGRPRSEAVTEMIEIATQAFPELKTDIAHEYGTRLAVKRAEGKPLSELGRMR